jgi:hypothetical protein
MQRPEDRPGRHPAVDPTAVVADLEPLPLDGLDQVEVFAAFDLAEHDVADADGSRIDGLDRAELPRLDLARHRVAAGAERDGLAAAVLLDVRRCPPHSMSSAA